MNKGISVIVSSMASWSYLDNFISSFLSASADTKTELCLHLDGNRDRVINLVEKYRYFCKYYSGRKRIKFNVDEHKGQSYGLNSAFGMSNPDYEYIIWACDDFIFPKLWDTKLMPYLEPDKYIVFDLMEPAFGCFPPIVEGINKDPSKIDWQKIDDLFTIRPTKISKEYGNLMSGGIFHRNIIESVGGFNEKFDPYTCNDMSFLWEIFNKNPNVVWVTYPQISVYHYQMASVNENPEIKERAKIASTLFKDVYGIELADALDKIKERCYKYASSQL